MMDKTIGIARDRQLPPMPRKLATWWARRAPAPGGDTPVALFATLLRELQRPPRFGRAAVEVLEKPGATSTARASLLRACRS